MSRWSDFGFPGITGVPVQTALEGLFLAARERMFVEFDRENNNVDFLSEEYYRELFYGTSAVYDAVERIRDMIWGWLLGRGYNWMLPNGQDLNRQNLENLIGEPLIDIPMHFRSGTIVNFPWQSDLYTWIRQCHRILNLFYLARGGVFNAKAFFHELRGDGDRFSDAAGSSFYENTKIINSKSLDLSASCTRDQTDHFVMHRSLTVPVELMYQWNLPGEFYIVSNAVRRNPPGQPETEEIINENHYTRSSYDPFMFGLPFEKLFELAHISLPGDAKYGYVIDPGLMDRFDPDIRNMLPDVPPGGYDNGSVTRNSCYANLEFLTDFRSTFEFYDPVTLPDS